ncbi:MAG: carboxypeptidase-like regulatory domain-containing protein [Planctomycetota bacterium]|nr:carboxypeptidase-like regulatory domain-containing protein [Planctomycetota bacterium]
MKPSQTRTVLALLALVLLVALALLLRSEGDVADTASAPEPTPLAESLETASSASESVADASEPSRTAPREEPAAAVTSPARDGLFRVRVLHHETLEPIAGAQVRWAESEKLADPRRSPFVFDPNIEERWTEHGHFDTSDASGEIWIDPPAEQFRVEATRGNLSGGAYLWRGRPDDFQVLLGPDDELRVEVVDAGGRPAAGVGVAVSAAGATNVFHKPTAITGADGLALLNGARRNALGGGDGPLRVRACTVASAPVERIIDSRPWPDGVVRLELSPVGSLRIRCVDPSGERIHENVIVTLSTGQVGVFGETTMWIAEEGELELPWVALGETLNLNANTVAADAHRSAKATRIAGPLVAGERVEVELVLEFPPFRLSGRALRPDGMPLETTQIQLTSGPGASTLGTTRTDAAGRFEFRLTYWPLESSKPFALVAADLGLDAPLELPIKPSDADFHVGDVLFVELPTLVTGRVVDPGGRGIGSAYVRVEARPRGFDPSKFEPEPGAALVEWQLDPHAKATSDGDGRFVLRRKSDGSDCRLRAGAMGFQAADPIELAPEMRDIEIVLQPGVPPVVGRVLVGSHDATTHLKLVASSGKAHWRGAGRFEIERESTDPIDLELFTDGESSTAEAPLVRIEGIREAKDPRLSSIDLRPLLYEFRFEVLPPPGCSIRNLTVSAALPEKMVWSFNSGPSVLVLVPKALLDGDPRLVVRLVHDDLPPVRFEHVADGARLQLSNYPSLELRVPETLPAASGEFTYSILARCTGTPPALTSILAGRSGRMALKSPGEWRVSWRVGNNGKELTVCTVVVGTEDVVCELDATPEAVATEIARHKAKRK